MATPTTKTNRKGETLYRTPGGNAWTTRDPNAAPTIVGYHTPISGENAGVRMTRYSDGTKEPSTLSSANGADLFNTNIQPVIDSANQAVNDAAQVRDEKNKADQKKDTGTTDIPPDVQEEMDSYVDPVEKARKTQEESWQRQMEDAVNTAAALTAAATKAAKANIAVLTNSWQERKALLKESNRRNEASWRQQFTRFGQAEYSPGMTADFIGQKEQEGMDKVKVLDSEYQTKVAEINAALTAGNAARAAKLTTDLQSIEDKMNASILEVAKETKATNDKLKEATKKASRENAIGDLITKYNITDATQLQDLINNDETGAQIGDVSLEEIDKVLKIMGLDPAGKMAGLTADYKTYQAMKKNGELEGDWTYTEYLAAVSAAKRAPKTSSSTDSDITDSAGDIMTFEEFKFSDEAKQLLNQEMKRQVAEDGTASLTTATADSFLKKIYDENAAAYYRDNPDASKKYTASNIPTPLRENLMTDISNKFTLQELISAYPDISSSYITSTFNAVNKKKKSEEESTISDEEFINSLKGE